MADTLTLTYPPHGTWVLHPPSDPYGDGYVLMMPVELHDDGLSARHTIDLNWPNTGGLPDLASYFEDLADHWHGWRGDRTWRSLSGSMVISAAHDGQGLVTLAGTLTHGVISPPDGWHVSASQWKRASRCDHSPPT